MIEVKNHSFAIAQSLTIIRMARGASRVVTRPQWPAWLRNGFKNVYNFVKWSYTETRFMVHLYSRGLRRDEQRTPSRVGLRLRSWSNRQATARFAAKNYLNLLFLNCFINVKVKVVVSYYLVMIYDRHYKYFMCTDLSKNWYLYYSTENAS